MVFLDEMGRMREHTKIDNLHDGEMLDEFFDLLKRRKPDVIAIGGFSMATMKLEDRVKEILRGPSAAEEGWGNQQAFDIPVVFVKDDVARIYQHSKRSVDEFPSIPPIAKYCVGLARYLQSPLNEFAALGSDITAITFSDEVQHLVCSQCVSIGSLFNCFSGPEGEVVGSVRKGACRCHERGWGQHQSGGGGRVLSAPPSLCLWSRASKGTVNCQEDHWFGESPSS